MGGEMEGGGGGGEVIKCHVMEEEEEVMAYLLRLLCLLSPNSGLHRELEV